MELVGQACLIEYRRFSKFTNKKDMPTDMVAVAKQITDSFVVVENKDKHTFLIPLWRVENIRFLGEPRG